MVRAAQKIKLAVILIGIICQRHLAVYTDIEKHSERIAVLFILIPEFYKNDRVKCEKRPFVKNIFQKTRRFAGIRRKIILHDSAESTHDWRPFLYAL